ncbi:exopolysaccharide biosynthesis polyprenyl glycosylphosphotransferase [Novosphingobium malaysiense]|uniref:Sugar transferase n=1 Tax=Novosphingobium malaysiense TaxID=1348853 RepID=A0A0B1ZSY0_9SPHN|nr:exopolysaccharide biosynthesis polyprenyl glycosylphosphotransferase [Novosphingobium malaysiense]KHK92222.1 sugar transferase [Novosphingobium malaysiense]
MNAPVAVRPVVADTSGVDDLLVAPSRERRRLQCYLALLVGDVISLVIGFCVIGYIFAAWEGVGDSLVHVQLILPIFVTLGLYNGAYSIHALREAWTGIFRAMLAIVIAMAVVIFVQFLIKPDTDFSRSVFNGGALAAMLAMGWTRLQLRSFVTWRCGNSVTNELIIDDGGPQVKLRGAIRISAAAMDLRPDLKDPNALDRLGLVMRNIDRVIVSCPAGRRVDWAMMLKGANVDGEVLDDEVARLGAQGARVVGNHGLLLVSAGPLGMRDRAIKRLFDLAFAGAAIVALSPLLIFVALAIKLQDGGPVFFMQRRMGRGNRFFNMYKFRSMTQSQCDSDGNQSASKDDKRITRVGRFIRRTSIDELPQLFNVLLGDMSLVGPRPHATGSLAGEKLFWEVDHRYWQRHCLKPGLSGLAQIRGYRGATDHESDLVNRLQSDLEYLEGWTIMRDIKIIFLTLRVLVHDRAF